MAWFSDIKDLKRSVGKAVSTTHVLDSFEPGFDDVERDYLNPTFGAALVATIKGLSGTLTTEQTKALALFKKAVGFLGILKTFKYGAVEYGEGGLYRVESDAKKGAYRRQENEFRDGLEVDGWEAVEQAFLYLEASTTYGATLKATPQYKTARSVFTYSAALMREQYQGISRRTYNAIWPTLRDTHIFEIKKLLPAQFYTWLKNIHDTGTPTAEQAIVIDYIKKIETYYAVEGAMYRNLVKLNGTEVVTVERAYAEDGAAQQKLPSLDEWRTANSYHREVAITYTKLLREYVETNKSLFPTAISTDSGGTNADADAWLQVLTDTETTAADEIANARRLVEM